MRISRKDLVLALLVLSAATLLTPPSGFGQGWVTVTSLSTFTTTYSTWPESLDYDEMPYSYDSGTNSFYLSGRSEFKEKAWCVHTYFKFHATASQKIHIEMRSSDKVTFNVMSKRQFDNWIAHLTCLGIMSLLGQPSTTSFSRDWVVPEDGIYYFTFLNILTSGLTITFKAGRTVVTPYSIISTLTRQNVLTVTGTSVYTTPGPSLGRVDPMYFAIVLVAAVIIVIVPILAFGKKKPSDQVRQRTKRQQPALGTEKGLEKQFCVDCGSELPVDSKFCNKCGTKQP